MIKRSIFKKSKLSKFYKYLLSFNFFYYFLKIFLLILLLVFSDLFTKSFFTDKYYFIDNYIYIYFSKNLGSAFSMFSQVNYYNLFIITLSLIILISLFIYFLLNLEFFKSKIYLKNCLIINTISILFISGILGNLYDRIVFGYVRDFIGIKYFSIFNFADIYLSLAFILYLFYEYKFSK